MANSGALQPPVITNIIYQNPVSPAPADYSAGLTINLSGTTIVAGQLMQGGVAIATFSPVSSNQINLPLPYPLSDNLQYFLQVQTLSSTSAQPNWAPANTTTAPVVASDLDLKEAYLSIQSSKIRLAVKWTNNFPFTAYIMSYKDGNYNALSFISSSGNSSIYEMAYSNSSYAVVLRALIPSTAQTSWPPSTFPTTVNYLAGSGVTYALPTQAPQINSVSYDGETVIASWPALTVPANVDASYELLLSCNGATSAFKAGSTGGAAILTANNSATWAVSARVKYGVIVGPDQDSNASPVVAPVALTTGSVCNIIQKTDPVSGKITLSWDDYNALPQGSTITYNLAFSGGSPVPAAVTGNATTSYTLPNNSLTVNQQTDVSITRVVATANPATTSTGPSVTARLATNQPSLFSARYDGTSVCLAWVATTDEVVQYLATLTVTPTAGNATSETHYVAGSATTLTFQPTTTISSTDTLSVTLQAAILGCAGPGLPSASMPVSFVSALFVGTTAPYTYPATSISNINSTPASGIVLYLPQGNYLVASKTFAPVTGTTYLPFSLTANTGTNSSNYPYLLTIAQSAWTISANSIRTTIQTAYTEFLRAAESDSIGNFTPWGISVLQETIARYMPQSYAEMFYYSYGMNLATSPNVPHIDLRPGMVLRIMPANFMVVPGYDLNGQTFSYLDGYTNNSPLDYDINSYNNKGNWMLGFDTFISQLVASGVLTVCSPPTALAPNVGGVAEAADLYSTGFQNPFYRLFIPTKLLSPSKPGATTPSAQFNLVSANSFKNLEGCTNPSSGNTNTYFRGRAVLKVCIRVNINGNEAVIPIGTTLNNILERAGKVPPKSGVQLQGLKLERAMGQADPIGAAICQADRTYAVRFDHTTLPIYSGGTSALDIPLLHGDQITF